MSGDEVLQRALRLLFEAVPAGSRVILFGSRAPGQARPGSDYDFLVVEPQVNDRFAEMVRLHQSAVRQPDPRRLDRRGWR